MNVIGCSDLNYCAHIIEIGGIGALLIMHVKLFIICKLADIPVVSNIMASSIDIGLAKILEGQSCLSLIKPSVK